MTRKISLLILVISVVFLSAAAQDVISPLDVAKIKSVTSLSVSPLGDYIAYTLSDPADPLKENRTSRNHLYLLEVSSGKTMPFVTQGSLGAVKFRPGNNSITFLSRRDGDSSTSLYEISLTGGEASRIFSASSSISTYDWAPDGKQLLYLAGESKATDDSGPELPYEPEIYEEDLTFRKAFVHNMETGKSTTINMEGHFSVANWSPDGSSIVVVTSPSPLVDDFYMAQKISVLKAGSFEVTGEVDHSSKLGEISWSPDGKTLAFLAGEDIHDPTPGRLLVVPASGGTPKNLDPDYEGMFDDIEWKDNKTILFLSSEGTMSKVGTIRSDGSSMKQVLSPKDINITSMHQLPNGGYGLLADSPMHPRELFVMGPNDKAPKRMTDSNPWLKDRKMAPQEVISYKARDGREIEGILIRPLNEVKGNKYPMITVVHGGPESHYNNGWLTGYSSVGQMGAANGFAVFYPNYRGSTGRGVEFAKSSQGDLAGKEFDDIVDGVDYLIESGLVDKDKVGVTGGSYGGYATAWLSTYYSDRFAAGVMFVGISNNLSKWGTSDIPEELYLVHARKRVWDDYEWWLKRSPVYYVDKAKTPLLIMHGKNDTRVYPGQSMELYRHIKTRTDTPVRLVFYPGEGHGNRNSTARLDYNLRSMRWFQKYLKNEEVKLETKVNIEGN